MDPIILDKIEFNPNIDLLLEKLRVKKGTGQEDLVLRLLEESLKIARPKATYILAGVEEKYEDGVVIDGTHFKSRVMRVNLNEVHRAFPYIRTCGRELYEWKESKDEMLDTFYAEEISQMALESAGEFLTSHLKEKYGVIKTSSMNPGSLDDWPLTDQIPLFQLLGDPMKAIGVELLDSMLMIPNQTVSGIRFETEEDFSSCQLCPREVCSHRQAPFDQELFKEKYQ
jgi:hypothetical protein